MIDFEFKGICKTYNPGLFKKRVLAVDKLNLKIHRGEVFGLIGPNGAGKSTTIRLLLGLIRPSQGEIFFREQPLSSVCVQREIGYLPENPYLYDHLTLNELLSFCGTTSGLAVQQTRFRSDELLDRLDLKSAASRPLRSFSKGMLQRAGICFALMHDPAMVILDEPMSGLDPIGRKMVFDLIVELKERGRTVFFCSHILSDVERLCDRIGIMVGGRLVDDMPAATFETGMNKSVNFELSTCSAELLASLSPFTEFIINDGNRHQIGFKIGLLPRIARMVEDGGGVILSCRAEQAPLERHFLRVVKGIQE